MDNMTCPIKSGQIVLGLEIHGFEMCDFSLCVIIATSRDVAVSFLKKYKYICMHMQKDSRNRKK